MSKQNADKWFSRFIRLRDSKNGYIKCISCGKLVSILESDCGHYVNRKHMSLRYSEINTAAQCRACNRFDEGNLPGYTIGLQEKYGIDIVKKLLIQKNTTLRLTENDYKEIASHYRKKVKELEKVKEFKF